MRKPRTKKTREDKPELVLAGRSERWAFWTLIAGLAAIIVAAFLAVWTVMRSEDLARRSGAFDRPATKSVYREHPNRRIIRVFAAVFLVLVFLAKV